MNRTKIEFIGFLFGEGCFTLNKKKHTNWGTTSQYLPMVIVSLRDDDGEILKWAQKTYGGSLIRQKGRWQIPNQNAIYRWSLNSSKTVLKLCDDVLTAKLPSKKLEQVRLLRKVASSKVKRFENGHKGIAGRWYSDKEIEFYEQAWLKLKAMKKYKLNEQ